MLNWYALYTKPKSERQVEQAFAAKRIETYFPYVLAPKRAGRSPIRPYFPCYLFAHVDLDTIVISQLNWVPGMRQVVCFAGTPARVDERLIAAIRQRLEEPLVLDEQGELIEHGDQVVITQGPFQDANAIFDRRLSSAGRVRVLIQMLQHWATLDVEANALRKVPVSTRGTMSQGRPERRQVQA